MNIKLHFAIKQCSALYVNNIDRTVATVDILRKERNKKDDFTKHKY